MSESESVEVSLGQKSLNSWIVDDIKALTKEREDEAFKRSSAGQALQRVERKQASSTRLERPNTAGASSQSSKKLRVPFNNFEGCLRRSQFSALYDDPANYDPNFSKRPKTTGQLGRIKNTSYNAEATANEANGTNGYELDDNAAGVVMIDVASASLSYETNSHALDTTMSADHRSRPKTPGSLSHFKQDADKSRTTIGDRGMGNVNRPTTSEKRRSTGLYGTKSGNRKQLNAQMLARCNSAPEMELIPRQVSGVTKFCTPTWNTPLKKGKSAAWGMGTTSAWRSSVTNNEDVAVSALEKKLGSFKNDPNVAAAVEAARASALATAASDATEAEDDVSFSVNVSRAFYRQQQQIYQRPRLHGYHSHRDSQLRALGKQRAGTSLMTDGLDDDMRSSSARNSLGVSVSLEPTNTTASSSTEVESFPSIQAQVRDAVAACVLKSPMEYSSTKKGAHPSTWEEFTAALEVGSPGPKPGSHHLSSKRIMRDRETKRVVANNASEKQASGHSAGASDDRIKESTSPMQPKLRRKGTHNAHLTNFMHRNQLSANYFTKGTLIDIRRSNKEIQAQRLVSARERRRAQMLLVMEQKTKAIGRHDELVALSELRKRNIERGRCWIAALQTVSFARILRERSAERMKLIRSHNRRARAADIIRRCWSRKFSEKMLTGTIRIRRAGGLTLIIGLRIWRKGVKANLLRKFLIENNGSKIWIMKHFVAQIRKAQRCVRDFIATTRARIDNLDLLWLRTERRVRTEAVEPIMVEAQLQHQAKVKQLEKERLRNSLHWRWHKTEMKSKLIFNRLDGVEQKRQYDDTIRKRGMKKGRAASLYLGGAMEAKKENSKKMRIEQARDEAMWNAMARDPVPTKVRRQFIKTWMRAERQRHIEEVDKQRDEAMKSIIHENDVLDLLESKGQAVSKRMAEKQLGCLGKPQYPIFKLLSNLSRRSTDHHTKFWVRIEEMIRDDVEKGMARIMSSGRADTVIGRAVAMGAL